MFDSHVVQMNPTFQIQVQRVPLDLRSYRSQEDHVWVNDDDDGVFGHCGLGIRQPVLHTIRLIVVMEGLFGFGIDAVVRGEVNAILREKDLYVILTG